MSESGNERNIPRTQSAPSGGPPEPPKRTARDLQDPEPDGIPIHITELITVENLAVALGQKPFKVVADLMGIGIFCGFVDTVDFQTASRVIRSYGYEPKLIR